MQEPLLLTGLWSFSKRDTAGRIMASQGESLFVDTLFDPELYVREPIVFPSQYDVGTQKTLTTEATHPIEFDGTQLTIDDIEFPVDFTEAKQPKKRVAFGGFVKPTEYDPAGEHDLESVTPAQVNWMRPNNLRKILFTRRDAPDTSLRIGNLLVNPYEHGGFIRYPRAHAAQAKSSVLGTNEPGDEKDAAARRAINHQLDRKLEPMKDHVGKLTLAQSDILELLKEQRMPGFAHKSPDWMVDHISTAWLEFEGILHVLRIERGWNDKQAHDAKTAFIARLVTGSQSTRVGHWLDATKLAHDYLDRRIGVFTTNIVEIEKIIADNPLPPVDEAA